MTRLGKWLIILIMLLGFGLRTYRLSEPLGDWHSWRQADTASVTAEYQRQGRVDWLAPRYHDLSSIPSGLDNPEGFRFVEFPLRDGLHFYFQQITGLPLVVSGRLLSILFSTATIGLIYLLVTQFASARAGLASALIYAILPYNIYYGRVILPEPMLVFCSVLALTAYIWFWRTRRRLGFVVAYLAFIAALLLKPTALIYLLPMAAYALATVKGQWWSLLLSLGTMATAVIPFSLWRQHIASHPEGIPASSWLFNGNGIRFKGAWFRWLFGERLGQMILGYFGLLPFGYGLARLGRARTETMVVGSMLVMCLAYLAIIATGNVQHDYYQIQIMPTVAIVTGLGLDAILSLKRGWLGRLYHYLLLGATLLLALALAWYEVQGFFWVNNRAMVAAGQRVQALTPPEALIIAPYLGDTAFLFQTGRRGWPIGGAIEDKIARGASYYVTTTKDAEFSQLRERYTLIEETPDYAVIRLTPTQ